MPPLSKKQKQNKINDLAPALQMFNKEFTAEELEATFSDKKKEETHELAVPVSQYRKKHFDTLAKYSDIKIDKKRFQRIAAFYLDVSGTPAADAKNREFLNTLTTEEGCRDFANRVAGEFLRIDPAKCLPSRSIDENVRYYSKHAHEAEITWVCNDLINDASDLLAPEVVDVIRDRYSVLQSMGAVNLSSLIAASDLYTCVPDMTEEEIDNAKNSDESSPIGGFEEVVQKPGLGEEFTRFIGNTSMLNTIMDPNYLLVKQKAEELSAQGLFEPFSRFTDENGKRLNFYDGLLAMSRGEKVTLSTPATNAVFEQERKLGLAPASRPIVMPEKSSDPFENGLYDAFGKEALAAQGKGFQQECGRLLGVMNGAKLWYTGGSPEYKKITRLLKETSAADTVPNRDEAVERMDEILAECEKYIASKNPERLKKRETDRLNAVISVRDSLAEKRSYLRDIRMHASTQHIASEINATERTEHPFHVSEQNQKFYHTTESERKAAEFRKALADYRTEGGAIAKLAADAEKTVITLSNYANSDGTKRPALLLDGTLRPEMTKIALIEMIRDERANGNGEKGKIETMLDSLAGDEAKWKDAIGKVADRKAIIDLAESIDRSPADAAKYFVENGSGKLLAELKTDLKATFGDGTQMKNEVSASPVKNEEIRPAEYSGPSL